MNFVDSHCHLYADQFANDRTDSLQKAISQGVNQIILPNIDADSMQGMRDLAAQYPKNCFPMMGLHPCSVTADVEKQLEEIKTELDANPKDYIGVGEIGIDLYWDKTFIDAQIHAFKTQCKWAVERDQPIAIHVRDSFNEVFNCLDELNLASLKGIFHCFTGNEAQAKKALSYDNFMLGIGGVVTFKNTHLRSTLKDVVPLDRLVLETDSPYLAPHPNRGKRNQPSYIPLIAETLGDVYNLPLSEIAAVTTGNCHKLFPSLSK